MTKEETQLHINTTISGFLYARDAIDQALRGEKREWKDPSEQHEPLALILASIGEIVDGVPVQDIEAARRDLLFAFELLHHLRGGFYSTLWELLARAHERVADLITTQEAKTLLGEHAFWLGLDARLGHIHPLEKREGVFHTYDAMFLVFLLVNKKTPSQNCESKMVTS